MTQEEGGEKVVRRLILVLSVAVVMMAMLVLEAGAAVARPAACDTFDKYLDNPAVYDIGYKFGCY